jgi:DNA polymerase V
MAELLALDLVDKGLVADQLVLAVGYDIDNLKDGGDGIGYRGSVTTDMYGRAVPKHAQGTANLGKHTASTKRILEAATELFERIVDPNLLIRRLNIAANHVIQETAAAQMPTVEQLDLFSDPVTSQAQRDREEAAENREKRMQQAVIGITKRYGKNALLKGMNLEEGATTTDRNQQIGGHKA